jgi:general secretion pathway protein G
MSGTAEGSGDGAWRCPKCATSNPADVTQCLYCGESPDGGQPVSLKPKVRPRLPLLPRVIWSSLVALVVLLISVWVAFLQYQGSPIRYAQEFTLREIGKVQAATEAYREETGALPQTLREVADWSQEDESWNLRVDDTGAPLDSWRRPLQYETDGTTYRITSYGYDGKPGGTGLYYDLSNEDLGPEDSSEGGKRIPRAPEAARANFTQFLTDTGLINSLADDMHGSGLMMVLMCVLASVATFVVAFLNLGHQWPVRGRPHRLAVSLAAIVIAALYVALTMAGLEAPSGH